MADLASIPTINLGPCKYLTGVLGSTLSADLPCDFRPSSGHDEFLRAILPVFTGAIDAHGWDTVWDAASNIPTQASFTSRSEWASPGLFWGTEFDEGFYFRAFRYAAALLYAHAEVVDVVSAFQVGASISASKLRQHFENGGYEISTERDADWDVDSITIDSTGRLGASRTWNGPYLAITASWWGSSFNDGWQLTAAIADYYFWWSIRLYDYVRTGQASDLGEATRLTLMSNLCARAALTEIADIAATMLHEFSHTTGWEPTWWECSSLAWEAAENPGPSGEGDPDTDPSSKHSHLVINHQECSHYNLEWLFLHCMYAYYGMPTSTLPDGNGTVGTFTATRFDVDSDDPWDKDFSYPGPSTIWQACAPADLHGFHENLWTSQHDLTVTWSYPAACASGSSSGRQNISVAYL